MDLDDDKAQLKQLIIKGYDIGEVCVFM